MSSTLPYNNPVQVKYDVEPQNPIKYSLTNQGNCTFSCAGFVAESALSFYGVDVGNPERISTNGGSVRVGLLEGINVPRTDVYGITPNGVHQGALNAGGKAIVNDPASKKRFVNGVTGNQLRDTTPHE